MRKVILLILTFYASFAYSQGNLLNFKIVDDTRIIWQKVFDTNMNKNDVIFYLKTFGGISILEEKENSIIGFASEEKINFKRYKATIPETSVLLRELSFQTIIEFKDNQYRVTVYDIAFSKDGGVLIGGFGRSGYRSSIFDNKYISNGRFKKLFSMDGAEYLDRYMNEKFVAKIMFDPF